MIFDNSLDKVSAVLEWEMASLGKPIQDIAWFNYIDACFSEGLSCERLSSLRSYQETLHRWKNHSGFLGEHYDYCKIFAGMRFALLLSRIMVITRRSTKIQGNFAGQMLKRTMNELI